MPTASTGDQICTIRIELEDTEPLIWREVEAPISITLDDLHDIIQIAMDWENEHLFEFTIAKQKYAPPDEFTAWSRPTPDSGRTLLRDVLRPRRTTFHYLYDFGDSWRHKLIVTQIRAPETGVTYPRYIGGEFNGPPDDCGGTYGFYETLAASAAPDKNGAESDEWGEIAEWADDFDPTFVDVERIAAGLSAMANRLQTRKPPRWKKPLPTAKSAPLSKQERTMASVVDLMVRTLKVATPPRAKPHPSANNR